jgi:hypothetical protein
VAERRSVDPDVVGSTPTSRPILYFFIINGLAFSSWFQTHQPPILLVLFLPHPCAVGLFSLRTRRVRPVQVGSLEVIAAARDAKR